MGGLTVPGPDPSRWERIAADAAAVLSRRGGSLAAPDREPLARIAAGEGPRVSLEAVVARVGRRGCDTCVLLQALAVANIAAEAVVAGLASDADRDAFYAAAAAVALVAVVAGVGSRSQRRPLSEAHSAALAAAVPQALAVAGCCPARLRAHAGALASVASLIET